MVRLPFKKKKQQATTRTILVNRRQPEEMSESLVVPHYTHNKIKTAKYSIVTFLPKNLLEQFRRIANFYFLCVAVIQLSINSPVSPLTSVLPLVLVICVTAVKQGYEDWLRHREDNKVNNSPSRVLLEGEVKEVRTRDIEVGDIVVVAADEQFPCDLLLLMSSDAEGKCSVTTANLDGETNLKTFLCPDESQYLTCVDDLWKMRAVIECQLPHANLYDFKGKMEVYRGSGLPTTASLNTDNLLPRGARLKNTSTVYGVAIYTGEETKMALNSKMTSNKFSTVEKSMNNFLVFFLAVLLLQIIVCTVLKYLLYTGPIMEDMWYLGVAANSTVTVEDVVQDSFFFPHYLQLYHPHLSLRYSSTYKKKIEKKLSILPEMQKFIGAMFIEWDDQLICGKTGERCKCNTSDLNEELGQVQYLFTDKTGTLTENCMNFRHCSVEGLKYVDVEEQLHYTSHRDTSKTFPIDHWPDNLDTFLETLALCHTVQVTPTSRSTTEAITTPQGIQLSDFRLQYQAASPDEKALVEACARYGVVFEGQVKDELRLSVRGHTKLFKRLQVLEFDSDRKCMSVVVREEASGRIWLLTKGAESSVLRRCSDAAHLQPLHDTTLAHIDDYALMGLRTLAVARRELTKEDYQEFAMQLSQAKQMVEGREAAVREVTERMEAELRLLGATGVEDLLQEGVQETLEALRAAGIKVWVLTGDKVETAVNIAYSCGHFKRFMTVLSLTSLHDLHQAESVLQMCWQETEGDSQYGLVVDGTSLHILLENLKEEFYSVCRRCTAVVCCRMSPRQKAETVRLVKTSRTSSVCSTTGANDVSMIQEAHVGIGVMGKEGRQAVRCSDFAFARFRFLKRVLLLHAFDYFYVRGNTLVQYSFYKNVAFITPQVFFAIWSAFSPQSVYDSLSLTMYNITFTSLPVIVYGLLDQNLPPSLLLNRPELYQRIAHNSAMSWLSFCRWNCFALWHSCVVYFGLMLVCSDDTCGLPDGQTSDLYLLGTTLVSLYVFITNFKLVLESHYFTLLFLLALLLTFVGYVGLSLIYQGVLLDAFNNYGVYWTYYLMFKSWSLMLASVLLVVASLLPDLLHKIYLASKDVRVRAQQRRKRKTRAVSLKAYISHVNKAFDPTEGSGSLWEVTKREDSENGRVKELGQGSRELGQGSRELGQGSRELGQGSREIGQGSREIGQGSREIGQGIEIDREKEIYLNKIMCQDKETGHYSGPWTQTEPLTHHRAMVAVSEKVADSETFIGNKTIINDKNSLDNEAFLESETENGTTSCTGSWASGSTLI
ncbi:LOW QUALITY PROTEIN: phospholipid-transporting ATPase IF-like [Homarus americanus]|uniref:LOW QUALITY PROTEIN: phospholipid-transporting ATPase IF-like n=1 Tax=Homarus americanus TaxID=6706 RepID=UPI001C4939F2|nr:LOW QUALITY PROTEIN: phospholipid-transporting ATPase IF-like [Homarus americanus]